MFFWENATLECCIFVPGEEAGKALSLCIDLQCIVCHTTGKNDDQVSHRMFHYSKCINCQRKKRTLVKLINSITGLKHALSGF